MARPLPLPRSGAASTATPARPMISPVQRRGLSRSVPPVSRAATTPMIGTAAISSPASELGSRCSAADSRPQGTMISSAANASSGRQYRRRPPSCPDRSASGSSSTAPSADRVNTTMGTETSRTATLMNR